MADDFSNSPYARSIAEQILGFPAGSLGQSSAPTSPAAPLFARSAMVPTPPPAPAMTRALSDYSSRSPAELAALRMQEATRPTAGRADIPPEHVAGALVQGASLYGPGLLGRALMAAPRLTGALAGGGLGMLAGGDTQTEAEAAGEQPQKIIRRDPPPVPNPARKVPDADLDRIDYLRWSIDDKQAQYAQIANQISDLAKGMFKSPPGTQARAQEGFERTQQALQKQIEDDRAELVPLEHKWRSANVSMLDQLPGVRAAWNIGAPAAATGAAAWLGRRMGPFGAVAGGGLTGGLEGYLRQEIPNSIDMGLPATSPTRQQIEELNKVPDWERPDIRKQVLIGSMLGGLGGLYGYKSILPPNVAPPRVPPPMSTALPPPTRPLLPAGGSGGSAGPIGNVPALPPPSIGTAPSVPVLPSATVETAPALPPPPPKGFTHSGTYRGPDGRFYSSKPRIRMLGNIFPESGQEP